MHNISANLAETGPCEPWIVFVMLISPPAPMKPERAAEGGAISNTVGVASL